MLACHFAATGLKGIGVVPAIRVKRILHQGSSQQEDDLLFGHANPQAVDHLRFERIALANIHPVGGTAMTTQCQTNQNKSCNENFSHFEP